MNFHQVQYTALLAWRSIRSRWVQSLATVLVVSMALALFVTVAVLGIGVRRGITEASDPFGTLVIGPKGDPQQLVLSTLLLNGDPLGTIDLEIYQQLEVDPRADLAIPLAMAENINGIRIIGTTTDFFRLQPSLVEASPFQIADGLYFEDIAFEGDQGGEQSHVEAVLGAFAAEELGLALGDEFVTAQGLTHVIVGILQPTNTVFDRAVFVPVIGVWAAQANSSSDSDSSEGTITNGTSGIGELTAVLVKPSGFAESNQIWQDFYLSDNMQAAFPGQELGKLLRTFRQLEDILNNVGLLAAVIAGLTIFLAIYSSTVAREQMIAVMRGVGAGRGVVLGMVLVEALIIALLGSILARALGYAAAWVLASALSTQNTIPIPVTYAFEIEWLLWLLPVGLGLLAGLIPALLTYRLNIIDKLFAS
ncbi:MAG: FtsX-like permease family protein [Chloroflexota bacterium]